MNDVYEEGMTRDEYVEALLDAHLTANLLGGCSCHINPPCSFCVNGFSLDFEEYLDLALEDFDNMHSGQESDPRKAYDRAMSIFD